VGAFSFDPLREGGQARPRPGAVCLTVLFHRDPAVDLGEGRRHLLHAPGEAKQL
jgi:hypothetical protein